MSKTTTNQNETQTETEDMLQEDQEFQETATKTCPLGQRPR